MFWFIINSEINILVVHMYVNLNYMYIYIYQRFWFVIPSPAQIKHLIENMVEVRLFFYRKYGGIRSPMALT
jgi:hypothetical protein